MEKRRLLVRRVKVTGKKCFEVGFRNGVNFITGDNGSGKTTILTAIDYGLGKKDSKFVPEIQDQSEYIYLELEINAEPITIKRSIIHPYSKIALYNSRINSLDETKKEEMNVEDFLSFVLEKLNIDKLEYYKSLKPEFRPKIMPLSFRELFRHCYLQQDGYGELLLKQPERTRKLAFEHLLKIPIDTSLEIEKKMKEIDTQLQSLKETCNILSKYYQEFDISPVDKNKRLTELTVAIDKMMKERESFRNKERDKMKAQVKNPPLLNEYQGKLAKLNSQINQTNSDLNELQVKWIETKKILQVKDDELNQLERLNDAMLIFSDIPITQCPVCSQEITPIMRNKINDNQCILCSRPLKKREIYSISSERIEILGEIIELKEFLSNIDNKTKGLKLRLTNLNQDQTSMINEMNKMTAEYTPGIKEIEDNSESIGRMQVEKENLEKMKTLETKLIEIGENIEPLKVLKDQLTLENRTQKDSTVALKKEKIEKIENYMSYFLERAKYTNFQTVKLDNSYLPKVNGHSYDDKSASEKAMAIIAYHYAFLRFALEDGINFPDFLMIDTPKQQEMQDFRYEPMLESFSELETDGNKFQLIITMVNLPPAMKRLEQYHIEGFIGKDCRE